MYRSIIFIFASFTLLLSCGSPTSEGISLAEESEYIAKGQEITTASFASLSGALQKAMKEGGVQKAIPYCNLEAMALTDSLSDVYGVEIRRTSLRYRNPKNAPDTTEIRVLSDFKDSFKKGEKPAVQLELRGDEVHYYQPIYTAALCLKCHGRPGEELALEDRERIKLLYPYDKAVGYQEGDLRGMWSLTFNPSE